MVGKHVIGVDCGSGSVRAGLFESETGKLLKSAVKDIRINNPEACYYEQSSDEIWNACITTVKTVLGDDPEVAASVTGIAFCATCSFAAIGGDGKPVSISKSRDPQWNIPMWMDHRAEAEADFINTTNHPILKYEGGAMFPEKETPKILWLKKNIPESFEKTKEFFDLGDLLHWKATGSTARSMCCIVCKWLHINEEKGNHWDETYFKQIGLTDALPKVGDTFSFPGDSFPISETAAKELGLGLNVKVGFSMIDAHSGVLGMIACGNVPKEDVGMGRLCLISGTSVCHMALNYKQLMVPGVWGPYYGVIFKDMHLTEGGQSAAGKLLDHIVMGHVAYPALLKQHNNSLGKVLSYLEEYITKHPNPNELTKDFHLWPDFHGNRSPIADPTLKGMICGLTLSSSTRDLAALYLATMQALAYGSRHILEEMENAGHKFKDLVICGGLAKSRLYLQAHADATGLPVVVPDCAEPVLLGAAMSAAAAAESGDLRDIVSRMAGGCKVLKPDMDAKRNFHDKKYKIFLQMVADQKKYRDIMKE